MFFFFKQKTAYEMRISDWSSDVCSSDLLRRLGLSHGGRGGHRLRPGIDAHQRAELGLECAEIPARQLGAAGELDRARIDSAAVTVEVVMEVRASEHAGRSDLADHLALGDAMVGRHLEAKNGSTAWRGRGCAFG